MVYTLTLPKGNITFRNNIYKGSNVEDVIWSPMNPEDNGGWADGDELHVTCTFNLTPDVSPLPPARQYAGLCVGACSTTDAAAIAALVKQAKTLPYGDPGQLLGSHSTAHILAGPVPPNTTPIPPKPTDIFYNAQPTKATFKLQPASRGTLNNYVYKWSMTYNGQNTVVANGNQVEIVFGYGDPMDSEVAS